MVSRRGRVCGGVREEEGRCSPQGLLQQVGKGGG